MRRLWSPAVAPAVASVVKLAVAPAVAPVVALAATVLICACDSVLSHEVSVQVAALPEGLEQSAPFIDHATLHWIDPRLEYRTRIVPAEEAFSKPLTISVPLGVAVPIVLTPVAKNGVRFSPAGALFPTTARDHRSATLEWSRGCAVEILLHAFSESDGLHGFNGGRYLELTDSLPQGERCWLDDGIAELLRQGKMRASAIRARPQHPAKLPFPAGRWIPANLLRDPVISDGDMAWQGALPYGVFHFFEAEQSRYLKILFTEQETIISESSAL